MSGFVGLLTFLKELPDYDEQLQLRYIGDEVKESQPFIFGEGRYQLVFDGKIYNAHQLRKSLENRGYLFESNTEAEVLANLFLERGIELFKEIRGMFALVLWDVETEVLYAARDRFGMKPLYYLKTAEELIISTEKNAILTIKPDLTINEQALQHYFSFQYITTPMTLTKEIKCLEPGHYLRKASGSPLVKHRYFHAKFEPQDGNDNQIINRVQEVLIDSVQAHVQNTDSIGAFLSGGIDSSLMVGIAKQFVPALKTFSVGFEEEGYSEIPIAKRTATELGVENISYTINSRQYVEILPSILSHLDDPLADPSCVPLYVAAELASKHSKVVLSGEGADELFGGYNIYSEFNALKLFKYLPRTLNKWLQKLALLLPDGMVGKSFIERGTTRLKDRYIGNAKIFNEKEKRVLLTQYDPAFHFQNVTKKLFEEIEGIHPTHQMQYIDIQTWLPGDILFKANRMTRAHSIELRAPFLDKEVFEVARKIPLKYKISRNQTKVILRQAAIGIIPEYVIDRKKLGFPVPLRVWLRDELYDWANNVLKESETDYLLEKRYCQNLLYEHARGIRDNSRKIWAIIIFMIWHRIFLEEHTIPVLNNELQ